MGCFTAGGTGAFFKMDEEREASQSLSKDSVLELPSQTSDLNLTEDFWAKLKSIVYEQLSLPTSSTSSVRRRMGQISSFHNYYEKLEGNLKVV